jgi:hypothetical protein
MPKNCTSVSYSFETLLKALTTDHCVHLLTTSHSKHFLLFGLLTRLESTLLFAVKVKWKNLKMKLAKSKSSFLNDVKHFNYCSLLN